MGAASLDEFLTWMTPRAAEDALEGLGNWQTIRRAILTRLKSDLITARAEIIHRTTAGVPKSEALTIIPGVIWKSFAPSTTSDFWETAQFSASEDYSDVEVHFFGVRFAPDGIERLKIASGISAVAEIAAPPPPSAAPLAEPLKNKGGRPRNDYWEPLLIEIARQLYSGDLQPNRQADIEKAMHDWLAANDHTGGETQVRQRAKSLWEAIEK